MFAVELAVSGTVFSQNVSFNAQAQIGNGENQANVKQFQVCNKNKL